MEFSGSQEKRVGYVTFGSPYAARRYLGADRFDGYMTFKTFTVKRHDDKSVVMSATPGKNGWEGFFYDQEGNQDGQFIATKDYDHRRVKALWYICGGIATPRVADLGELYVQCNGFPPFDLNKFECKGRRFPGKFSHLTRESCEDELSAWDNEAWKRKQLAESKIREEEWNCSPENKSATFRAKLQAGCLEPSVSFKTAQQSDPLLLNECLMQWASNSRVASFPLGRSTVYLSPRLLHSVFIDRTEYEFSSTAKGDTLALYYNEDVPEDLKYLVNEAAYSCVVDPSSAPPEGFWPMPWAKPSWEAQE